MEERIYSSVLSFSMTIKSPMQILSLILIAACKNKPGTHSTTISFFSKFFDANQGKVEGKLAAYNMGSFGMMDHVTSQE